MSPLLNKGRESGREIVIEVFHTSDGQPLSIHSALVPERTA